jgi:hypothetical protein
LVVNLIRFSQLRALKRYSNNNSEALVAYLIRVSQLMALGEELYSDNNSEALVVYSIRFTRLRALGRYPQNAAVPTTPLTISFRTDDWNALD